MTPVLNTLQNKAFNSILNSKKTTIITGSAGTGKTFVLSQSVKQLLEMDKKILICSPTHQSLKVIKNTLNIQHPNLIFKTIASALARFPLMSVESGDKFFINGKLTKVLRLSDYIFVDEISGVSEKDFFIINALSKVKKVSLFGDMCQLLPVRQKSIKLDKLKNTEVINLTEQMRNSSDIEKLAERNRIKITIPKQSTTNIICLKSEEKLLKIFLKELENSSDPLSLCYLAFTNKVMNYVSSKICINKFPYLRLNTNYNTFCKNGDILKINNFLEKNIYETQFNFFYNVVEVIHLETNSILSLNYVDKENYNRLFNEIEKLKKSLISTNDLNYKEIIINQIKYLESFPEFNSPFCLTVHKSQGSTYNKVFINTHDILCSTNKKRLLYVAISRAKNKLFISH